VNVGGRLGDKMKVKVNLHSSESGVKSCMFSHHL
jgi:hypothetical protein